MNRRKFMKTLGGTGVVVAASGFGLTQCDQMPDQAIQAWNTNSLPSDDREWILAHALLAPNPHNMQPWIADLRKPDRITLYLDEKRLLPETDPFGRQVMIGQGTFLEILTMAARERGFEPLVELFPNGSPSEDVLPKERLLIAHIDLEKSQGAQKDPLFQTIFERRSNKEPYEPAPLDNNHKDMLESISIKQGQTLNIRNDPGTVETLRDFAKQAMLIELETPRTLKESIDRMRIGADEITANPDGIDLHGPFFWWAKRFGMMTPEKSMTPGTFAYQGGIDYALGWANATYSMGWLTSKDNSRESQIEAGRTYVRLNLQATQLGVAMHPVSQILQEYSEMNALQQKFNDFVALAPKERVQMYFRVGYQETSAPSPRRSLAGIIQR